MAADSERRIDRRTFALAALATASGCGNAEQLHDAAANARRRPRRAADADPAAAPTKPEAVGPTAMYPVEAPLVEPPLFAAWPELARKLAYVRLGVFPTPVERAGALAADAGLPMLFVKRDDRSGEYGGGKTRKLELLLADAIRLGCKRVVTSGAVGSNHAVATAVYARRLGLRAELELLPEPASDHVRANLAIALTYGAGLHLIGHARAASLAAREGAEGSTYMIPRGGTSPLGNLGFVNAAFELANQVRAGELPEPDVLFLALGTMGSVAGLAVGLSAAGLARTRIVAVRASNPATSSQQKLRAAIAATRAYLRAFAPSFPAPPIAPEAVVIDDRQLGEGYAVPTVAARAAVERARRVGGLALETTYTGKALAALFATAPALRDKIVVFWCSNNSRPIDTTGARPEDLPPALRGWLPTTRDR